MKLRTKYWLKVFFSPSCWHRLGKVDPIWDEFLWTALDQNKIELVGTYEAIINDVVVWIRNEGYGDGYAISSDEKDRRYCSRATALYLRDQLIIARIFQRLKGPFDDMKVWKETGIHI